MPLSTQVYKWVPANLMLEVTLRQTTIPSRGGVEILLVASCYWNRDKLRPDGPLGSYADFTVLKRLWSFSCCFCLISLLFFVLFARELFDPVPLDFLSPSRSPVSDGPPCPLFIGVQPRQEKGTTWVQNRLSYTGRGRECSRTGPRDQMLWKTAAVNRSCLKFTSVYYLWFLADSENTCHAAWWGYLLHFNDIKYLAVMSLISSLVRAVQAMQFDLHAFRLNLHIFSFVRRMPVL